MAKVKAKGRKVGRNKKWCEAYRLRDQRGINKARKLYRHLSKYPDDTCAMKALDAISAASRKKAGRIQLNAEAA